MTATAVVAEARVGRGEVQGDSGIGEGRPARITCGSDHRPYRTAHTWSFNPTEFESEPNHAAKLLPTVGPLDHSPHFRYDPTKIAKRARSPKTKEEDCWSSVVVVAFYVTLPLATIAVLYEASAHRELYANPFQTLVNALLPANSWSTYAQGHSRCGPTTHAPDMLPLIYDCLHTNLWRSFSSRP